MFDPFFAWLEATSFSIWMRESPSIFSFPIILAVHTIGLGLLAGINVALDLRMLGFAARIPLAEFRRLWPFLWLGLWLNVLSGIALLAAYPTKALTNPIFYIKLGLIAFALAILRSVRRLGWTMARPRRFRDFGPRRRSRLPRSFVGRGRSPPDGSLPIRTFV